MRRTVLIAGSIALSSLLVGCGQGLAQPTDPAPAATAIVRATPLAATAVPSSSCDPVDQLFVDMFNGLTEAALTNAGIDRDAFVQALAGDREALRRYLEALGITADDEQLDALMGAGIPIASGLPFTLEGC